MDVYVLIEGGVDRGDVESMPVIDPDGACRRNIPVAEWFRMMALEHGEDPDRLVTIDVSCNDGSLRGFAIQRRRCPVH